MLGLCLIGLRAWLWVVSVCGSLFALFVVCKRSGLWRFCCFFVVWVVTWCLWLLWVYCLVFGIYGVDCLIVFVVLMVLFVIVWCCYIYCCLRLCCFGCCVLLFAICVFTIGLLVGCVLIALCCACWLLDLVGFAVVCVWFVVDMLLVALWVINRLVRFGRISVVFVGVRFSVCVGCVLFV